MKLKSFLFNQFNDGAESSGSGSSTPSMSYITPPPADSPSGGDTPRVDGGSDGGSGAAPATAAPSSPSLPLESVMELMRSVQQPVQQQAAPQMSEAEARKALKAVDVQREWISQALESDDPEVRRSAFQAFADQISEHARTLAQASARLAQQDLMQQFSPLLQAHQSQQMQTVVGKVVSSRPGMKPYENLVSMVTQQMRQEGWQSPIGGQQGMELVVGEVERRMRSMLPHVDFSKAPQAQVAPGGADFGGMPSLSGPGGSGGSGQSKKTGGWWDAFVS
jgi:hypothetical protein